MRLVHFFTNKINQQDKSYILTQLGISELTYRDCFNDKGSLNKLPVYKILDKLKKNNDILKFISSSVGNGYTDNECQQIYETSINILFDVINQQYNDIMVKKSQILKICDENIVDASEFIEFYDDIIVEHLNEFFIWHSMRDDNSPTIDDYIKFETNYDVYGGKYID